MRFYFPKTSQFTSQFPTLNIQKLRLFRLKCKKRANLSPFLPKFALSGWGSWIRKVRNSDCSPQAQSRHQRMTESEPVMYTQKCPQNEQKTLKITRFLPLSNFFSPITPQSFDFNTKFLPLDYHIKLSFYHPKIAMHLHSLSWRLLFLNRRHHLIFPTCLAPNKTRGFLVGDFFHVIKRCVIFLSILTPPFVTRVYHKFKTMSIKNHIIGTKKRLLFTNSSF